jgi:esterase/lipase superfamily enzyme
MLFHDDITCQRHLLLNGPLASRGIYQLAHTAVGFAGMADVPPTPTAGDEPEMVPPDGVAEEAIPNKEFSEVPVYFATDRKRTAALEPEDRFGAERNPEGDHLEYGRSIITIPKNHQTGVVERPAWWRFEFREDPKKHVTMLEPVLFDAASFYGEIRKSTAAAPSKELFLFIHGFNVTYGDAMRRTGQISYDLGFGGVSFCYSWPSQGDFTKYPVDKETSEWTIPHLTKVLTDLQKETQFEKVHVIAHSMGTRVLSYALRNAKDAGFNLDLNNVILAAPDIDADIFREQILPKIKPSARRLTMYASSGDQALNLSTQFNGSRRLGLSGDGMVVIPEMMDTVDASGIDTSLIGHSYYGSQGPVVTDLFKLLIKGLIPPERNLRPGRFGAWELPEAGAP